MPPVPTTHRPPTIWSAVCVPASSCWHPCSPASVRPAYQCREAARSGLGRLTSTSRHWTHLEPTSTSSPVTFTLGRKATGFEADALFSPRLQREQPKLL